MTAPKPVALCLAAGPGIGAAIARRFSLGGYNTVIVRRDASKSDNMIKELREQGCEAMALSADVRNEGSMRELFDKVELEVGPIEICVYNGGANTEFPLEETTGKIFGKVWELCCYGGFLAAREAARVMKPRQRGTILFSGATSSIRGREGYAAFSSAKFGLRSLSQSAAKELDEDKIHVAHVMINGAILSDDIARLFKERAGADVDNFDVDQFIDADSLADAYWFLSQQKPTCWTQELDIRTYREKW